MDSDTLKEYLVKIGIDIPMAEIQKFNHHMESFDKGVFGLVKRLNNFLSGWKAVIVASTAAAKKIASFTFETAKADLETQKLAKHMYLTNDSAKTLNRTLDAMGLQFHDLQDVALSPELFNQYRELVKLGKELTGGEEISNSLQKVREVGFEFTKLKMTLSYLGERVAYYISKVLDSPTGKAFMNGLKSFNNFLKNNLDSIARKIAAVLGYIVRMALRVSQIIGSGWNLIKRGYEWLEDKLHGFGKTLVAVMTAVGVALMMGPVGKFFLLLQAILLVIDDYMTYKEGGIYAIPWHKTLEEFSLDLGEAILNWAKNFWENDLPKIAALAWKAIVGLAWLAWQGIKEIAKLAWDGIKAIAALAWDGIKDMAQAAWDGIKDIAQRAWDAIVSFVKEHWPSMKQVKQTASNIVGIVTEEDRAKGVKRKLSITESLFSLPFYLGMREILPKPLFDKYNKSVPNQLYNLINPPKVELHMTVNGDNFNRDNLQDAANNVLVRTQQGGLVSA